MKRFAGFLRLVLAVMTAVAAVAASIFALPAAARAGDRPAVSLPEAGARAVAWLLTKQEADGGYGNGFSTGSDVGTTADAVLAFVAAGKSIASVKTKTGKTPLDFLASQVSTKKLSAGQIAKIALAVKASGRAPATFGGKNLVSSILAGYDGKTGVIGGSVYIHSLAMLALINAGAKLPARAVSALESLQASSGGWAFMGSGDADVDTTALSIQALIAAGQPLNSGAARKAIGYLRSIQNADGGFPYQTPSDYGTDTNANSTALVAQTIIAGGDQPESWAAATGNPLGTLVALQQPSGALAYQSTMPGDNVIATIGAIPALYRASFIPRK